MSIVLEQLFKESGVSYTVCPVEQAESPQHAAQKLGISSHDLVQTHFFSIDEQIWMVATAAHQGINLSRLQAVTGKALRPGSVQAFCWTAPVQFDSQIPLIVDESLLSRNRLYMASGKSGQLVAVDSADWSRVAGAHSTASVASAVFALPTLKHMLDAKVNGLLEKASHSGAVKAPGPAKDLPPVSDTVRELIRLKNRDDVDLAEVVRVIEKDESVAAHIMKHAAAPVFGATQQIQNVQQAVYLVLGIPGAINIALAVHLAQSFRLPEDGVAGEYKVWQDSLTLALLMRHLLEVVEPGSDQDKLSSVYLIGLLRNIGLLAMWSADPAVYPDFNHQATLMPQRLRETARAWFGDTHYNWGASLLQSWHLPQEIVDGVKMDFERVKAAKSLDLQLLAAAECLLPLVFSGSDLPSDDKALKFLSVNVAQVEDVVAKVRDDLKMIPHPARHLAA